MSCTCWCWLSCIKHSCRVLAASHRVLFIVLIGFLLPVILSVLSIEGGFYAGMVDRQWMTGSDEDKPAEAEAEAEAEKKTKVCPLRCGKLWQKAGLV